MNDFARIVFAAWLLAVSAGAGAQMYKCESADGKTSYADKPCGPGKKDAGPVEDQLNVAPAHKAPRKTAKPKSSTPGASTAKPKPAPPAAAAAPERRCFNVASNRKAGSSSTRCNDDPAAPDPTPTDERSKAEVRAK